MLSHHRLRHHLAGSCALLALAATAASAQAADLTITDAKIEGGQLVVTGTTATPSTWVRLDGQLGSDFNQKSGADGSFSFGVVYHPGDCIVGLQKVVSPTTLGTAAEALVADCGPAGVSARGAWKQNADYVANDLATYKGSTWRARRANSGKQPAEGANWEIFAAGATTASEEAASSGDAPAASPTGPAGGDLTASYPNPQIRAHVITQNDIAAQTIIGANIAPFAIKTGRLGDSAVTSIKVLDNSLTSDDLGPDSVGSSEVVDNSLTSSDLGLDSVTSSEIAASAVGNGELGNGSVNAVKFSFPPHIHTGAAVNIVDTTAHDGAYATATGTVTCGFGELLLSAFPDWSASGGHNELVFSGIDSTSQTVNAHSATIRVAYDGGAAQATFIPTAICLF